MISFELAGGSVVGRDHRTIPKNNQDAWHVLRGPDVTVAVVCDGCGSGAYSEVGARLGASLVTSAVARHARRGTWSFDQIRDDVVAWLRVLANQMDGNLGRVIDDHFLFTVVGVVFSGHSARFFSCGDGVMIINGEVLTLGPFPNNEPPYLAYALYGDDVTLDVRRTVPLDDLDHFLLGCDGAGRPGLLEVCESDRNLPGVNMPVGPISQFWTDDCNFSNPAAISRRLKLIGRDWPPRDPEHGLLADDTTIVVGRQR